MKEFKFSLLLSLYNKEKPEYLRTALESIRLQTMMPTETIIVFDGYISKELEDVVFSYQDSLLIKIIRLEHNVGLGNALNEGLKYCSYEWVFRMDTDDYSINDRFEKQIAYILNNNDVVLVGSQMEEFDKDIGDLGVIREVPISHEEIKIFSIKRNPFNHISVAFKKDIIEEVGGYQHHLYMEDYNLWLRVLSSGYRTANLPNVLVYARVGNNMLKRRAGLKYIKSEWQLFRFFTNNGQQSFIYALYIFIARTLIRLFPTKLLGLCYKLVRK